MPNSDNKFGTYNKQTTIYEQYQAYTNAADSSATETLDTLTVFANTDAAKAAIFTTEALAVFDECCTNLQWGLVADGNGDNTKLKVTFDFGTKGGDVAESDDWAGLFNSRYTALANANGWWKSTTGKMGVKSVSSSDHLF